jgi:ATP-dependent Clp protease ATP-binding subunit ClpA
MSLREDLLARIIGQPDAINAIVPFIQVHQANLSPGGRPLGVVMLLGPTGSGKTRTVEALAEVLHGDPQKLIKVNCGEYQMEHEVAKLIGAPPGYLGHRETTPLITQAKLHAITSASFQVSLVLFDEIEKAAESLQRLLLGILDRASLQLGDSSTVNFENSLVILTSNLGTRESSERQAGLGFERPAMTEADLFEQNHNVTRDAVRRKFSPEFINRIDSFITYRRLSRKDAGEILHLEIAAIFQLLHTRLGVRQPVLEITDSAHKFLLEEGYSEEYGARDIKRAVQRLLLAPLAEKLFEGLIPAAAHVWIEAGNDALTFTLERSAKAVS